MTFDEAVQQFQPAPFDELFLWHDTGGAYSVEFRNIMIACLDDGNWYYQVHNVSKSRTAKQLTLDLQHDPWAVLERSALSLDHDWQIGDTQDIIQYVKERYLKFVRNNDPRFFDAAMSEIVGAANELL